MLSVPGAVTVRGFSFFGDSYVYIIFDEGTDLYWARSRVLEYLGQVSLPQNAKPRYRQINFPEDQNPALFKTQTIAAFFQNAKERNLKCR